MSNQNNSGCSTTYKIDSVPIPIRIVCVEKIDPSIPKSLIIDFFKSFGDIESIQERTNGIYVQFNQSSSLISVLTNFKHSIRGHSVKVKAADPWQQPDHPLNTPPEQDSDSNILIALNNDCLQEVFKRLQLLDLLNVAETCVHFNEHAKETIGSKYKHLDLRSFDQKYYDRFLINFGSVVQSLDISRADINTQIIDRECKQLKALSLEHVKFNWPDVHLLFSRLETLKLNRCELNNFTSIDLTWKLKHLELNACTFFNIESIAHRSRKMHRWISMCPLLEKLTIKNHQSKFNSTFLCLIDESLSNLKSLEFDENINQLGNFQNDVQSLINLNSLTVLKLNFNNLPIGPLVRALSVNKIPIEEFKIIEGRIDEDGVQSLLQLERLAVFELFECRNWTDNHLMSLAEGLLCLRELRLNAPDLSMTNVKRVIRYANNLLLLSLKETDGEWITIDDYNDILNTIKRRPERQRFVLEISYAYLSVPYHILKENRDVFLIKKF